MFSRTLLRYATVRSGIAVAASATGAHWYFTNDRPAYTLLAAPGKPAIPPQFWEKADALFDNNSITDLVDYLTSVTPESAKDKAALYWRRARAYKNLAQAATDKKTKEQLTMEALNWAKEAVALDPDNFAANKWVAIAMGQAGDFMGVKKKVEQAGAIRDYFLRASELNPKCPTTIHLIGIWFYSLADLPWYQRKVVDVFLAKLPPATYQEALKYFMKAEETEPGFYSTNRLYIAKANLAMGNKEEAKKWLQMVPDMPVCNLDDKQAKAEAEEMLKKLK